MRNATMSTRAALAIAGLLAGPHGTAAAGRPRHLPDVIRRAPPTADVALPCTVLPSTWYYQILSGGTYWYETFIGHNPTEQTTAKIPVYIIPIKTVYGDISYSNLTLLATGRSALQSAFDSPVFKPYPFTLIKGNEFGKRQYLDAVEIINTWNIGGASLAYHTLLDTPAFSRGFDGEYPTGTLIRAATGRIYGTTQSGGRFANGEGTIFEITP
jgi:hypothetical protein